MAELNFNRLSNAGFMSGFDRGQQQRREQENQLAEQQLKQQANMQAQQFNALKMQGYQEDRTSKLRAEKAALFRDSILRAPDPNKAREVIKRQYADPDLGPVLQQTVPLEAALSEISDDIEQFRDYQRREALGPEGYAKSLQPKMTPTGDVFDPATRSYIPKPQVAPKEVTPPVSVAEYNLAQKDPNFMRFLQQRAAATRAPSGGGGGGAIPKAPPGYRYTPAGDLEAIPGGPAAVKQGEVQSKQETGRLQAFDILDSLGDAYSELDRMKAVPSQQRGALSNVLSSVAASPVGQVVERGLGTKAQTQRDVASSARLQLFAAVKNATGLSSQQLNSNVEFTTWLNSLTDPSRSIETNKTILENMRKFVDSNGTYSTKQGGKPAQPASGRPEGVGADWTLMTDKNNNRAWVSPDRKSFKEVK